MTAGTWVDLATGLLGPPLFSVFWIRLEAFMRRKFPRVLPWYFKSSTGTSAGDILSLWKWNLPGGIGVALVQHDYAYATGLTISVAVAFAISWWRKRRDKVKALIGAKSRALRDALVAQMPKPRPVLIPQRTGS